MISCGFELLVIEIIGVIWSNCRMRDVAETPSNFGITISYGSRKNHISIFPVYRKQKEVKTKKH